jgi:hypothetical protein
MLVDANDLRAALTAPLFHHFGLAGEVGSAYIRVFWQMSGELVEVGRWTLDAETRRAFMESLGAV